MRRSAEDKAETRQQIIRRAGRLFRGRGLAKTGVAEVMAEAGLTHGGFYRHFASKDDLAAAAIADALARGRASLAAAADQAPTGRKLAAVIDAYLNEAHCRDAARGCAIAALGPEAARAGGRVQAAYEDGVEELLALIAGLTDAPTKRQAEARAQAVLATLVGGLTLARALTDPAASKRALKTARNAALAAARG